MTAARVTVLLWLGIALAITLAAASWWLGLSPDEADASHHLGIAAAWLVVQVIWGGITYSIYQDANP